MSAALIFFFGLCGVFQASESRFRQADARVCVSADAQKCEYEYIEIPQVVVGAP